MTEIERDSRLSLRIANLNRLITPTTEIEIILKNKKKIIDGSLGFLLLASSSHTCFFLSIALTFWSLTKSVKGLLGYGEGLEVVNPDGGAEDAEEEAKRGRWKQEVPYLPMFCLALKLCICRARKKRRGGRTFTHIFGFYLFICTVNPTASVRSPYEL
ncbi:uncharacterized protein LOC120002526 [Tripterygium wilfordii]|uniref:uncharacterized protein LOC120002526 n=1 Tax=Tripterygium wilfordii TaxID=458696 RepID=UPI0018F8242B|nr:uncharacterized protein LOC120002526 [Tripterygium wilfordii]